VTVSAPEDLTEASSIVRRATDAVAVLAATGFVAWYLHPELLLTPTTATGGDMASHYYPAAWLVDHLLPAGRLTGWVPGNYAGYALFQTYFPLPFLAMGVLSWLIGLPIAFKLTTVAGLVGLPSAAYISFRLLRFAFPAPALAAVLVVSFLFHEGNSVWGGNVASTLAGEFTYSIGTLLLVVFAGTLYRGATTERGPGWVGNGALLAAIGLCHAYTLLAAAGFGAYLVLAHPAGRRATTRLVATGLFAFALMAFWAVPLVSLTELTTAYQVIWPILGPSQVFPPVLWPALAILVSAAGLLALDALRRRSVNRGRALLDHRVGYLLTFAAGSYGLYLVAWTLDAVDIRFLPFVQLSLVLAAAVPAAALVHRLANRLTPVPHQRAQALAALTLLVTLASLGWTASRIEFSDDWAAWNYGGFEATPGWAPYRAVNDLVSRTFADPRVAYEHLAAHNDAGSVRAFESLPLFSGASTLEGLYMQSTISSPFVFYIQSEISQVPSCPLLPYHCGRLDAARAAEHLRLFNVSHVIARSDPVRTALESSPDFRVAGDAPPFRVFAVEQAPDTYVQPLEYEPVVLQNPGWKNLFFAWFKRPGSGEVPLVLARTAADASAAPAAWMRVDTLPDLIPRRPMPWPVDVTVAMGPEEIRIHTSRPGHPLLIKVSYHPRWHVEGADRVWLASPSFMVVVPREQDVRLYYGPTGADRAGTWITLAALVVAAGLGIGWRRRQNAAGPQVRQGWTARLMESGFLHRRVWAPAVVAMAVATAVGVRAAWTDPWIPHREALAHFQAGEYAEAELLFQASTALAPSSAAAYYSDYYYALCAFRERRWAETLTRFTTFLRTYPDGQAVPEGHFRVAEALQGLGRPDDAITRFQRVVNEFPSTEWAGFATERLAAAGVAPAVPPTAEASDRP